MATDLTKARRADLRQNAELLGSVNVSADELDILLRLADRAEAAEEKVERLNKKIAAWESLHMLNVTDTEAAFDEN